MAAVTWTISLGAIVAMVGSVVAIAVMLKSGGPWKSVAEARAAEVLLKDAEILKLRAENTMLSARPSYEMMSDRIEVAAGLLVRHGLLLDKIEERLEKHAASNAEQYSGLLDALSAHTHALAARDEAIIEALNLRTSRDRNPKLRTRANDRLPKDE